MAKARRETRITVAALALLLQLVSPVWATWLSFGSGPPLDIPICTEHQPENDGKAPPHSHLIACPLCVIVSHAFYGAPDGTAAVASPVEFAFVVHELNRAAPLRGPPLVTARARAPPIVL
jgi:hypothetical protein